MGLACAIALALALAGTLMGDDGGALIGKPSPEWENRRWVQGGPLRLADLRGRPLAHTGAAVQHAVDGGFADARLPRDLADRVGVRHRGTSSR